MSKRTLAIAILVMGAVSLFVVRGAMLKSYANAMDTAHWTGYPLPPCFQDAKVCGGHILGTDENGRDVAARLVVGAQATLGVSLLAVVIEVVLGVAFGALARYGRAVVSFVITRVADAISCFAALPFILFVMVIGWRHYTPGPGLGTLVAMTAIFFSPGTMRLVVREDTMSNGMRSVLNQVGRDWASIILLLATVDFFGSGLQPPTPSWGNMLSNMAQDFQLTAWWIAVFPAICIFATVLLIEIVRRRLLTSSARP